MHISFMGCNIWFLSPFLQVTLADIKAYSIIEAMMMFKGGEGLEQTPLLKAHYERIAALPNIAAWLAKRPETEH